MIASVSGWLGKSTALISISGGLPGLRYFSALERTFKSKQANREQSAWILRRRQRHPYLGFGLPDSLRQFGKRRVDFCSQIQELMLLPQNGRGASQNMIDELSRARGTAADRLFGIVGIVLKQLRKRFNLA